MLEEHSELENNVMGTIKQGKFLLNANSWSSEKVEWLSKASLNFAFSVGVMDGNEESTHSAKVKLHRVNLKNFSLSKRALILILENYSGNFGYRIR